MPLSDLFDDGLQRTSKVAQKHALHAKTPRPQRTTLKSPSKTVIGKGVTALQAGTKSFNERLKSRPSLPFLLLQPSLQTGETQPTTRENNGF